MSSLLSIAVRLFYMKYCRCKRFKPASPAHPWTLSSPPLSLRGYQIALLHCWCVEITLLVLSLVSFGGSILSLPFTYAFTIYHVSVKLVSPNFCSWPQLNISGVYTVFYAGSSSKIGHLRHICAVLAILTRSSYHCADNVV